MGGGSELQASSPVKSAVRATARRRERSEREGTCASGSEQGCFCSASRIGFDPARFFETNYNEGPTQIHWDLHNLPWISVVRSE